MTVTPTNTTPAPTQAQTNPQAQVPATNDHDGDDAAATGGPIKAALAKGVGTIVDKSA